MPDSTLNDLQEWTQSRLGIIVGADGKGGSGTCIELEDGSEALLTARHVVIDTILTGGMAIARIGDHETLMPKRIRISSRSDAAYIVSSNPNPNIPRLKFNEWTEPAMNLKAGALVLPTGIPGEWKQVDRENRAIPFLKVLAYATTLSDPPLRGEYIVCEVDETTPGLPSTFAGMSGGPLFLADRKFIGVLVNEIRRIGGGARGEIYAIPAGELRELFAPLKATLSDYTRQEAWAPSLPLVNQNDQSRTAILEIKADMYWSKRHPDFEWGRFGRIQMIRFKTPPGADVFPINTESVFYPTDGTEVARKRALHEEIKFLLNRTGWGIEPAFLAALESSEEL